MKLLLFLQMLMFFYKTDVEGTLASVVVGRVYPIAADVAHAL